MPVAWAVCEQPAFMALRGGAPAAALWVKCVGRLRLVNHAGLARRTQSMLSGAE